MKSVIKGFGPEDEKPANRENTLLPVERPISSYDVHLNQWVCVSDRRIRQEDYGVYLGISAEGKIHLQPCLMRELTLTEKGGLIKYVYSDRANFIPDHEEIGMGPATEEQARGLIKQSLDFLVGSKSAKRISDGKSPLKLNKQRLNL